MANHNGDPVIVLYLKKRAYVIYQKKNEAFFYLVIKVNSHLECCNIDRFYHPIFCRSLLLLLLRFGFSTGHTLWFHIAKWVHITEKNHSYTRKYSWTFGKFRGGWTAYSIRFVQGNAKYYRNRMFSFHSIRKQNPLQSRNWLWNEAKRERLTTKIPMCSKNQIRKPRCFSFILLSLSISLDCLPINKFYLPTMKYVKRFFFSFLVHCSFTLHYR